MFLKLCGLCGFLRSLRCPSKDLWYTNGESRCATSREEATEELSYLCGGGFSDSGLRILGVDGSLLRPLHKSSPSLGLGLFGLSPEGTSSWSRGSNVNTFPVVLARGD